MTSNGSLGQISVIAAPLRKQVIDLLRTAILTREYEPGQRLIERDLCERLRVSRTVVREALRHLEAEGLVELIANRGPTVTATSVEQARSLYEVREALEALAARCFALRAMPAQKKRLRRAFSRVQATYHRTDVGEMLAAKDEFYRVLCEGAGNSMLWATLRTIHVRVHVPRGLPLGVPGRPDASLAELERVMLAIEAGDSAAAAELISQHVRNAGAAALDKLAEIASQPLRQDGPHERDRGAAHDP
jgi:DNA-binding GntR family transcriptional regulator